MKRFTKPAAAHHTGMWLTAVMHETPRVVRSVSRVYAEIFRWAFPRR